MSWYYYEVYGLKVQVDRRCLYLPEAEGAPDVIIQAGEVPSRLSAPKEEGICYTLNETECLLNIETIARFHVVEGNRIIYQVAADIEWSLVCQYLYKAVFSVILCQRKVFVLHAAAVVNENNGAVLLMGSTCVGKSTLAARLIQGGYRFISDELSVVRFVEGVPYVCPGPRMQTLWGDSCEQLMMETVGGLKLVHGVNRYCFDAVNVVTGCSRVEHVVSLDFGMDWECGAISGGDKIAALSRHVHHRQFICGQAMEKAYLESVLFMTSSVRCLSVKRPRGAVGSHLLYDSVLPFFAVDLGSVVK